MKTKVAAATPRPLSGDFPTMTSQNLIWPVDGHRSKPLPRNMMPIVEGTLVPFDHTPRMLSLSQHADNYRIYSIIRRSRL